MFHPVEGSMENFNSVKNLWAYKFQKLNSNDSASDSVLISALVAMGNKSISLTSLQCQD